MNETDTKNLSFTQESNIGRLSLRKANGHAGTSRLRYGRGEVCSLQWFLLLNYSHMRIVRYQVMRGGGRFGACDEIEMVIKVCTSEARLAP
jgi:hypothetical protein